MPASKKGQKRYTAKKDVAADKEVVQPTSDAVVADVKPVAATLPDTKVPDATAATVPEVAKTAVPEVVGTTASSDAAPSEKAAPTTAGYSTATPAETAGPVVGDMQPLAATAAEATAPEVAAAETAVPDVTNTQLPTTALDEAAVTEVAVVEPSPVTPAETPPGSFVSCTTPPESIADESRAKKDASSDEESTAACTTSLQSSSKPGSFTDVPQTSMCCVRATCDFTKPGESLALIGGDAALGAWNTKEAVILSTSAESFPTWSGKVMKPAAGAEFKLVIVRADGSIMWEPIEGNRTWPVDDFSKALAFGSR